MPAAPRSKVSKKPSSVKFIVDCSQPVKDEIFDMAAFEKFLHDRVKVNGRTNNLAEGGVSITRDGDHVTFTATSVQVPKRYLKYLTKKFLKKHGIRDWLKVIATTKDTYVIKYYQLAGQEAGEETEADE